MRHRILYQLLSLLAKADKDDQPLNTTLGQVLPQGPVAIEDLQGVATTTEQRNWLKSREARNWLPGYFFRWSTGGHFERFRNPSAYNEREASLKTTLIPS